MNETVIPGKKFRKFSVTARNPILPTCQPTHYRHVGRPTTDTWADTLSTCRPTHCRRIDRNTYLFYLLCRRVGRPVGRIGFLTFYQIFGIACKVVPFRRNSGKCSSIRHRKFRKQQTGIFGRMERAHDVTVAESVIFMGLEQITASVY